MWTGSHEFRVLEFRKCEPKVCIVFVCIGQLEMELKKNKFIRIDSIEISSVNTNFTLWDNLNNGNEISKKNLSKLSEARWLLSFYCPFRCFVQGLVDNLSCRSVSSKLFVLLSISRVSPRRRFQLPWRSKRNV